MVDGVNGLTTRVSLPQAEEWHWPPGSHKEADIYDFTYHPKNDGYYPSRIYGKAEPLFPFLGGRFYYNLQSGKDGVIFDYHSAEKLYAIDITPEQRQHFCSSTLEVRIFTEQDIPATSSAARKAAEIRLVGKHSVFAKVDFIPGICICVCGGELICEDNSSLISTRDRTNYGVLFHVPTGLEGKKGTLVCDNVSSRIKSIFEFQESIGWCEAKSGYNAVLAAVPTVSEVGEHIPFPVIFAIAPIKAGEEIRVKYGYSNEMVDTMMNGGY